jgi:hypothetical protein
MPIKDLKKLATEILIFTTSLGSSIYLGPYALETMEASL